MKYNLPNLAEIRSVFLGLEQANDLVSLTLLLIMRTRGKVWTVLNLRSLKHRAPPYPVSAACQDVVFG